MTPLVSQCLERGVLIPAPEAVCFEDILPERIAPQSVIYPGTVLKGASTFIGAETRVGMGGGAYIENTQIGARCSISQGVYRDSTLLDRVSIRNGAELRDNCLLEEGADLGHTVGLKQTILFPNVVLGSLINFCDAILCGGTDRKNHTEVGSCMALYNYTPQGDKFPSRFGDVPRGLLLNQPPIFIGGQTQIISPVYIGFSSVLAAGSKLTRDIHDGRLVSEHPSHPSDRELISGFTPNPDRKVASVLDFIDDLHLLKKWYEKIRVPFFAGTDSEPLMQAAISRIHTAMEERKKRLRIFAEHISQSLEFCIQNHHASQTASHQRALAMLDIPRERPDFPLEGILQALICQRSDGKSYPDAVQSLPDSLTKPFLEAYVQK